MWNPWVTELQHKASDLHTLHIKSPKSWQGLRAFITSPDYAGQNDGIIFPSFVCGFSNQ